MPLPSATESRWRALLADFHRGGLTHAEFCRRRGVSLHTFRKRLYGQKAVPPAIDRNGSTTTHQPARFLPVTLRPVLPADPHRSDEPLTLVLPGERRIAVGPGFDSDTLRRLIDCLERLP